METLYSGDFVKLVKNEGYEYIFESDLVFILCKRIFQDGATRYAIRSEFVPPYSTTENYYTILSGSIEDGETAYQTAIRELKEETGIELLTQEKLIPAYTDIQLCKITNSKVNLFHLTIEEEKENIDYKISVAETDGTENERKSQTIWLTLEEIVEILTNNTNFDLLFFLAAFIYREASEM